MFLQPVTQHSQSIFPTDGRHTGSRSIRNRYGPAVCSGLRSDPLISRFRGRVRRKWVGYWDSAVKFLSENLSKS